MGDEGPARRKHRRKGTLPPLPEVPPHIMWPGEGSGYQAHPWSPAGALEQHWQATARMSKRDRRLARLVVVVLLGAFVAYVAVTLVRDLL